MKFYTIDDHISDCELYDALFKLSEVTDCTSTNKYLSNSGVTRISTLRAIQHTHFPFLWSSAPSYESPYGHDISSLGVEVLQVSLSCSYCGN